MFLACPAWAQSSWGMCMEKIKDGNPQELASFVFVLSGVCRLPCRGVTPATQVVGLLVGVWWCVTVHICWQRSARIGQAANVRVTMLGLLGPRK